jgi:Formin Homology 2 Domain
VLDAKAAQNLSILLGGSLKYMSYEDIKRSILHCDESVLSDSVLQQLIQYIPTPEQLKKLEEYKDQYENLAEAEQFSVTVRPLLEYTLKQLQHFNSQIQMQLSSIKRLVPRLKSISFKQHYSEMVQDIKPVSSVDSVNRVRKLKVNFFPIQDIVAATAACEEMRDSKKFAKLLELVLLVGNYLNSGTKNAQAVGFEISYLPKVCLVRVLIINERVRLPHYSPAVDQHERRGEQDDATSLPGGHDRDKVPRFALLQRRVDSRRSGIASLLGFDSKDAETDGQLHQEFGNGSEERQQISSFGR